MSQRELAVAFLKQPEKAFWVLGRWAAVGLPSLVCAPEQFALLVPARDIAVRLRLRSTGDPDLWETISLHGRVGESI